MVRVLVLCGYGFNCEEETAAGYRLAGAEPTVVHAADWFAGLVQLADFEILHFPGGFSFGDDLGSGQVFANRLKNGRFANGGRVWDAILAFLGAGGRIIGICNGFQILVRAGLVPNLAGIYAQEVALAPNGSGKFEDRWVRCQATGLGVGLFGQREFDLPVRHGEGRLEFANPQVRDLAQERGLIALTYLDADGGPAIQYPANPNGADLAAAALVSADGQVFGMMPHPEAYLTFINHPDWGGRQRRGEVVEVADTGVGLFSAWVAAAAGKAAAKAAA